MHKNGFRPGDQLRELRFKRGMSMRDVQAVTARLAKQKRNRKLTMTPSRLCDLENEKVTPNVHRLYALSVDYRVSYEAATEIGLS
jgi:transcriptional regulator with XRE-family HTH domain